jgi:hypothetical protein
MLQGPVGQSLSFVQIGALLLELAVLDDAVPPAPLVLDGAPPAPPVW